MARGDTSCIEVLMESAIQRHGAGTLLTLLEALVKARNINIESAPHGCFTKMFYARTATSGPSTSLTQSPVSSTCSPHASPMIHREEILSRRPPPGLHKSDDIVVSVANYAEVFDKTGCHTADIGVQTNAQRKPRKCRVNGRAVQTDHNLSNVQALAMDGDSPQLFDIFDCKVDQTTQTDTEEVGIRVLAGPDALVRELEHVALATLVDTAIQAATHIENALVRELENGSDGPFSAVGLWTPTASPEFHALDTSSATDAMPLDPFVLLAGMATEHVDIGRPVVIGASDCYDEPEGNSMVNSRINARELHCKSMLDVRRTIEYELCAAPCILGR